MLTNLYEYDQVKRCSKCRSSSLKNNFQVQSFTFDEMKNVFNACCNIHSKNYYKDNRESKLFQQKKNSEIPEIILVIIKSM